jgi:hypothetical protein
LKGIQLRPSRDFIKEESKKVKKKQTVFEEGKAGSV